MKLKQTASELFRARPEASFIGYLPATLVVIFFGLYALHEGVVETVPYLVLLAVCVVQLQFRTLAGWLLLLRGGTFILPSPSASALGYLYFAPAALELGERDAARVAA